MQPATGAAPVQHVARGPLRQEERAAEVGAHHAVEALRRRLEHVAARVGRDAGVARRRGRGGRTGPSIVEMHRLVASRSDDVGLDGQPTAGPSRLDQRADLVEAAGRLARRGGRAVAAMS